MLLAERDRAEAIAIVAAERLGLETPYPIQPRHHPYMAEIALAMVPRLDYYDWMEVQAELETRQAQREQKGGM